MADPVYIFQDWFSYTDAVTQKYLADGAASVAAAIQPAGYQLLVLYVVIMGIGMMQGLIREPVVESAVRFVKIATIYTLGTSSTIYATEIATFLYDWPSEMAGVVSGGGGANTSALIDNIAASGLDLASKAWENAGMSNIGGYVISGLIFTITLVVTAVTATIIIMAKYTLALLLTLGPIFISMLMFERTRQLFDRWVGSCLTAGFTIVLVSAAAAMLFKYFEAAFAQTEAAAAANGGVVSLTGFAPAAVSGIITVFLILSLPMLASGLAGGVNTASAAASGWAWNKLRGALPQRRGRGRSDSNSSSGAGQFSSANQQGGSIENGRGRATGMAMSAFRRVTATPRQARG